MTILYCAGSSWVLSFSSTPGLPPLDNRSTHLAVTSKNKCRHYQMSPGGSREQSSPCCRTTALDQLDSSQPSLFASPQLSAFGEEKAHNRRKKERNIIHLFKTVIATLLNSTVFPGDPIHDVNGTLESSFHYEWGSLGGGPHRMT